MWSPVVGTGAGNLHQLGGPHCTGASARGTRGVGWLKGFLSISEDPSVSPS